MLQDILPHVYHSEYVKKRPSDNDILILQKGNKVLLVGTRAARPERREADSSGQEKTDGNQSRFFSGNSCAFRLPTVSLIRSLCPGAAEHAFYLFSIDEQSYFSAPASSWENDLAQVETALSGKDPLAQDETASSGKASHAQDETAFSGKASHVQGETVFSPNDPQTEGRVLSWQSVMVLREMEKDVHSFGGAVGWQLANWYDLHRFCGRCGRETVHSETERAIICPACGHPYYPRISPVVIIAIVDGSRILLTRYNRSGYRRHALVAGFVEIGETLEDAVRREVMEEVGLRVKNIRYIESQPWPFSSSLIAGFCAEADGDPAVHLNMDGGVELAEAVWMDRSEVEIEDNNISLTWDMIRKFKNGEL